MLIEGWNGFGDKESKVGRQTGQIYNCAFVRVFLSKGNRETSDRRATRPREELASGARCTNWMVACW